MNASSSGGGPCPSPDTTFLVTCMDCGEDCGISTVEHSTGLCSACLHDRYGGEEENEHERE